MFVALVNALAKPIGAIALVTALAKPTSDIFGIIQIYGNFVSPEKQDIVFCGPAGRDKNLFQSVSLFAVKPRRLSRPVDK